jgi:hypothetical protein
VGSLAQAAGYYSYPGLQDQKVIVSGVYTPTLTNLSNVDASTALECFYWRIGPMVFVRGACEIDATSTASDVQLQISFPLPSTLAVFTDCKGFLIEYGSPRGDGGSVIGDASLTQAVAVFRPAINTNRTVIFDFVYVLKGQ